MATPCSLLRLHIDRYEKGLCVLMITMSFYNDGTHKNSERTEELAKPFILIVITGTILQGLCLKIKQITMMYNFAAT